MTAVKYILTFLLLALFATTVTSRVITGDTILDQEDQTGEEDGVSDGQSIGTRWWILRY
jgi:hypothetical protein